MPVRVDVIHFGTTCVPHDNHHWFTHALALFSFYPQWLLVFNFAFISLRSDFFFFMSAKLTLVFWLVYLEALAHVLRFERASHYDHKLCHSSRFAFPDARFVTAITYSAMMLIGAYNDKRVCRPLLLKRSNLVIVTTLLLGYAASTIVTHYFTWELLAANTAVAICLALLGTFAFHLIVSIYKQSSSGPMCLVARLLQRWTDMHADILAT